MYKGLFQKLTPISGFSASRAAAWLNAILVILFSYILARMTWQFVSEPGDYVSPSVVKQAAAVDRPDIPTLEDVAALHLLGVAGDTAVQQAVAVDAPETRLNLVLKGVFAGDPPEDAIAIIASGAHEDKVYRKGDVIAGAARVHQILPDRVILERSGQLEALYLPRDTLDTSGTSEGRPPASPAGNPQVRNLGEVRQILRENPQEAFQLIKAQPVMAAGKVKGYRIRPGKDRALFARAGLRPGDIVTAIDGMALSDQGQMMQIYEQLKNRDRIEVTIERGGRSMTMPLSFE